MKFKIKMRDNTIIYTNNICIFGGGIDELTTWCKGPGNIVSMDRKIPLDKVFFIECYGMLIYV